MGVPPNARLWIHCVMYSTEKKVGPPRGAAPQSLRAVSRNSRRTLGDAGRGFVQAVANGLAERHRRDRNRAADNRQDQGVFRRRGAGFVLHQVDESLHYIVLPSSARALMIARRGLKASRCEEVYAHSRQLPDGTE